MALVVTTHHVGRADATPSSVPDATWQVQGVTFDVARDGDGNTYVGGFFSGVDLNSSSGTFLSPTGTGRDPFTQTGPLINGTVFDVTPDGAGGYYVAGEFSEAAGLARTNLVHVRSDGSVDPAWNPTPDAGVDVVAFDGTYVYAAGVFTSIDGQPVGSLVRLDGATGALDTTWAPDPRFGGIPGRVHAIEPYGGSIYVGGNYTAIGGTTISDLTKFPALGPAVPDPTWRPNIVGQLVTRLVVGDGALFAAGNFTSVGGTPRKHLAKLALAGTGAVDPTWQADLDRPFDVTYHLDFTNNTSVAHAHGGLVVDGTSLYVASIFEKIDGVTRAALARVSTGGAGVVDSSWDPAAQHPTYLTFHDIAVVGGAAYVSGQFSQIAGVSRSGIAKLSTSGSGTVDPSWNPGGYTNSFAAEGSYLFAGGSGFSLTPSSTSPSIFKILPNGTIDTTWDPIMSGAWDDVLTYVSSIEIVGGDMYVAGSFTDVDGVARHNLAKLDVATGELDPTWNPDADRTVARIARQGTDLFLMGDFTHVSGIPRQALAKVSTNGAGALDPVWAPVPSHTTPGDLSLGTIVVDGSNVYVGGSFTSIDGTPVRNLARLSTSGPAVLDTSWRPEPDGRVSAVVPGTSTLYIGGEFTTIGGAAHASLAQIAKATGAPIPAWHPDVDGTVLTLGLRANELYVGGIFSTIGGVPRSNLALVDATGSGTVDPSWDPSPDSWVFTAKVLGGKLFVGGFFEQIGGAVAQLARFWIADDVAPNPNPMTATAVADSATQITWTADTATDETALDAMPYSIDSGTPAWQISPSFVESGLAPNTEYTRVVRARDAAGNVSLGSVSAYTRPNTPTGFSAVPRDWVSGGYRVQLNWSAPSGGATSYNIRSSADGYASVLLNVTSTTQTITGLAAGTAYAYEVCAVNPAGDESTCTAPATATTAPPPPATSSTDAFTTGHAHFDWPDVLGAGAYAIYIYTNATCTTPLGLPTITANSEYTFTTLPADRYLAYTIRSATTGLVYGAPTPCIELDSATKRTAIDVSLDSPSATLGSAVPGVPLTGSSTITVGTYGAPGYTIAVSADQQLTSSEGTILAFGLGDVDAPVPWSGHGFGFSLSSATNLAPKWGSGTRFAAFPTTPTQIHDTGAAFAPNTTHETSATISYRLVTPPEQAPGAYSAQITYAVVPTA